MSIKRPLEGVRVLEIASIIVGPLAGQYLGDMGADVIKLEPPEGDRTRDGAAPLTEDELVFPHQQPQQAQRGG